MTEMSKMRSELSEMTCEIMCEMRCEMTEMRCELSEMKWSVKRIELQWIFFEYSPLSEWLEKTGLEKN
jgi:hypothetical protein